MANSTNTTAERARQRAAGTMRGLIRRIPRAPLHTTTTITRRRDRAETGAAPLATHTNIALAGLQLLIGYQWLVSGVDKLLLGAFPDQVGRLLAIQVSGGKLPAFFAALLHSVVVPNAPVFGYAIMLGETLSGLGLIAAGLFSLARPAAEARVSGRLWMIFALTDRLVATLAPIAAVGAGLLGLSYYLLDGAPTLWFMPSLAYGGAIAPGMIVALASLVLVVAQVAHARADNSTKS